MTVTYTISVDGLVGAGSQNVAAIFDATGCRVGPADFLASNGYYTGLMLVYGNQTLESGLEVRIWDAELDSLPTCEDRLVSWPMASPAATINPIVFYGAMIRWSDAPTRSYNFLVTAITDDGSCIYPGCDDPTAAAI